MINPSAWTAMDQVSDAARERAREQERNPRREGFLRRAARRVSGSAEPPVKRGPRPRPEPRDQAS